MASLNPLHKLKKLIEHNPLEILTKEPSGIIKGAINSAKEDLIKQTTKDMWREILQVKPKEGSMHEGQEIDLSSHHAQDASQVEAGHVEKPEHSGIEAHIDYKREILHYRESLNSQENNELHGKVNEIIFELKRLIDSSSMVQAEFNDIAVTNAPAEVGKYHLNFFEWMLATIQAARMKVEDSGAWLATMSSKKGKKDYWGMFKKHGTSFGMSNERSVSTQTG